MPRTFLSHSSLDDDYVLRVSALLGRSRVHIDSKSFAPGEDFRDEIRRALDDSDSFVFFVSHESLESAWCQFELDEAEVRGLRGVLRRSLAIFIGDGVDVSLLPEWLRRVRAVEHVNPARSAHVIGALLNPIRPGSDHPFLGRNEDIQRGVRKLALSEPLPRIVVASGLEGVGRRTYLQHLMAEATGLDIWPMIVFPAAGTLEDLFIATSLAISDLKRADAEKALATFRSLTLEKQAMEIAAQLAFVAQDNCAPCIVDRGGMLNADGDYREDVSLVFDAFVAHSDVYLCLAHTRSPGYRQLESRQFFYHRGVRPLHLADAQALVSRLLRDVNVTPTAEVTAVLGEGTGGYPPAAYFMVSEVEDYGLEVVSGDPDRLADFHTRSFTRFIRDLPSGEVEQNVLYYLSNEEQLPVAGIAVAIGHSVQATTNAVRQLMDLSVIELVDDEYRVTAPIQTAIRRGDRALRRRWYEEAFKRLEAEYWTTDDSMPPLSIVDATLRAGFRVGKNRLVGYGALVRPSILVRAAEEMYHQHEYETALEYADRAEGMASATPPLVEVRIKSLAQLGRWNAAHAALRSYREFGERRQWYLNGFIDRKRGEHAQACDSFQRGYSQGDKSISVLRDYADSLLRIGAADEARNLVLEALEREPSGLYLLDLHARIEIADGLVSDADQALDALEAIDFEERFILQRRASFLLQRRGNAEAVREAVGFARRACDKRNASVACQMLLARALIKARDWTDLAVVRAEISRRRTAPEGGLDRLAVYEALEKKHWRGADQAVRRLPAGSTKTSLEMAVLDLKCEDYSVPANERDAAAQRVDSLKEALGPLLSELRPDELEMYD